VSEGVREVTLAKEPRARVRVEREFGVKDLHGGAAAVPMRGGVDGRHPADTEQHVEAPLLSQHLADPGLRPRHEWIDERRDLVETRST